MLPVFNSFFGITVTILQITRNKIYTCKKDCWRKNDCPLKKRCSVTVKKGELCGTEIIINILNATLQPIRMRPQHWELVDTNGYAFGATSLCDELYPPRTVNPDSWEISTNTQVKVVYLFPELDGDADVATILYSERPSFMKFEIRQFSEAVKPFFNKQDKETLQQVAEQDFKFQNIRRELNSLKKDIFARCNNVLIPREKTNLDNRISNSEFSIRELINQCEEWKRGLIEEEFIEILASYYKRLENVSVNGTTPSQHPTLVLKSHRGDEHGKAI